MNTKQIRLSKYSKYKENTINTTITQNTNKKKVKQKEKLNMLFNTPTVMDA
jgi:hypothetical protein